MAVNKYDAATALDVAKTIIKRKNMKIMALQLMLRKEKKYRQHMKKRFETYQHYAEEEIYTLKQKVINNTLNGIR